MCLAIPAQVVNLQAHSLATVRVGLGPSTMEVSTLLLPAPPKEGDWLIVHAGFALRVMDPEEARQSVDALLQYARALEAMKAEGAEEAGPAGI